MTSFSLDELKTIRAAAEAKIQAARDVPLNQGIFSKASLLIAEEVCKPQALQAQPRTSGGGGLQQGDHVRYDLDGRTGILGECLQDGDASITWDDGKDVPGMVKWNNCTRLAS